MSANPFDETPRRPFIAAAEPWPEEPPPPTSEDDYAAGKVVSMTGEPIKVQQPTTAINLIWFNDIQPTLDAEDFVEGLLIRRSSVVVYGDSNAGKTFWVTDLALHVSAGMEWCGRTVDKGGVIYCALEGGIGFQNRVTGWREEHDLAGYDLPFASVQQPLNLSNPQADVEPLIEAILAAAARIEVPVALVVVDTLSRALAGGNENAPDDMGALVAVMDLIRQRTGAAVMFIHHSGKDAAKGARGHSLLRAAIDTEIEIVADDQGARAATVVKQRELPKGDVFPFQLRVVELGQNRRGKPVTTCVVEAGDGNTPGGVPFRRRLTGHNKRALEVLADLVTTAGQEGHSGVPSGLTSVPEKWWRERFYERAMPGDTDDAKQKAFRRAAMALVSDHFVGMANRRVWIASRNGGEK